MWRRVAVIGPSVSNRFAIAGCLDKVVIRYFTLDRYSRAACCGL